MYSNCVKFPSKYYLFYLNFIINKFIYINLIILILLCAFVYFSTIYTLKVLNKDDISMMKSLYIREKQSHITGKRCLK